MLQLNPHVKGQNIPQRRSMQDLINRHPDALNTLSLSRRDQFNAWMYLHDLCSYGLDFFHQFKSMLQEPEPVEQIPLVKTPIYAARAMNINNSMVTGNICAVNDLLQQGGISDPAAAQTSEDIDMDSPDIIERTYIKVGVAAVDLGDRRAVVTSVDVQATEGLMEKYYCVCMLERLM